MPEIETKDQRVDVSAWPIRNFGCWFLKKTSPAGTEAAVQALITTGGNQGWKAGLQTLSIPCSQVLVRWNWSVVFEKQTMGLRLTMDLLMWHENRNLLKNMQIAYVPMSPSSLWKKNISETILRVLLVRGDEMEMEPTDLKETKNWLVAKLVTVMQYVVEASLPLFEDPHGV